MSDADQKATLQFPGGTAEFPILTSVDGASSIDLVDCVERSFHPWEGGGGLPP